MLNRPRVKQLLWLLSAAACLTAAGLLQPLLDVQREDHELVPPGNVVAEGHPEYALLTIAPGGLRAVMVNYLWVRSENLKQAGRHHEAMQLSELICQLMPRFPGVWGNQAWNMAWNISVKTQTPEERWLWVYNGVKLLRDRGIPMNPKSLGLYREVAWIFFSKMGQRTDEMHRVYKQRWAHLMQELLGAPPYGETPEVIAAFRPIAEAPLDKDRRRQGRTSVQADQRIHLLEDPDTARYAALLAGHGVHVDETLLTAYNRFSGDQSVDITRVRYPEIKSDTDRAVSKLINDPAHAVARAKMLAFVRAQILWNVYKMDPAWMLRMMEKYHAPLDWRMVQTSGLYWVTYGIEVCQSEARSDVDALNTDRIVLNSLKALTANGRLTYQENPPQPESPEIFWSADWRYIEAAHRAHVTFIQAVAETEQEDIKQSPLRDGHMNFLKNAILTLWVGGRRSRAQHYLDWVKENYPAGRRETLWILPLDEFVRDAISRDEYPYGDLAKNLLHAAIVGAYEQLVAGNRRRYADSLSYARRLHALYQKNVAKRNLLPPFEVVLVTKLAPMLVRPRTVGMFLTLDARSVIYQGLPEKIQLILYNYIKRSLVQQCRQGKLDFSRMFPEPPGLAAFLAEQQRRAAAMRKKPG